MENYSSNNSPVTTSYVSYGEHQIDAKLPEQEFKLRTDEKLYIIAKREIAWANKLGAEESSIPQAEELRKILTQNYESRGDTERYCRKYDNKVYYVLNGISGEENVIPNPYPTHNLPREVRNFEPTSEELEDITERRKRLDTKRKRTA